MPLISAPRSRLRLSCWLIFNPSAQQGQTCWTGSSACSPPFTPLPSPITPRPAAPPRTTPLTVCPLSPFPGLLQGAKPFTVPSFCPGRGHGAGNQGWEGLKSKRAPARGSGSCVENSAGSADTGLAPALCQTALGRHVCLHSGAGAAGWVPRVPLALSHSLAVSPVVPPPASTVAPRAPSLQGWEGRDPDEGAGAASPLLMLEG